MNIVNGYVCQTSCDVTLAKKGVNPAYPNDDPTSPNYNPAVAAEHKAQASGSVRPPAVTFGGQLASVNGSAHAGSQNSTGFSMRDNGGNANAQGSFASSYTPGSFASISA